MLKTSDDRAPDFPSDLVAGSDHRSRKQRVSVPASIKHFPDSPDPSAMESKWKFSCMCLTTTVKHFMRPRQCDSLILSISRMTRYVASCWVGETLGGRLKGCITTYQIHTWIGTFWTSAPVNSRQRSHLDRRLIELREGVRILHYVKVIIFPGEPVQPKSSTLAHLEKGFWRQGAGQPYKCPLSSEVSPLLDEAPWDDVSIKQRESIKTIFKAMIYYSQA